ncbi:hypothetical protein DMENIID0001_044350 [Sergentomyia squamirostris]
MAAGWNPAWQAQFATVQNITEPMFNAMTPDQKMQIHQNWQQWQSYQEQYAKWHAQYGEQYEKELQKKEQPTKKAQHDVYRANQQAQITAQAIPVVGQASYTGYQQAVQYPTIYQAPHVAPALPLHNPAPPPPPPPEEPAPPPPPPDSTPQQPQHQQHQQHIQAEWTGYGQQEQYQTYGGHGQNQNQWTQQQQQEQQNVDYSQDTWEQGNAWDEGNNWQDESYNQQFPDPSGGNQQWNPNQRNMMNKRNQNNPNQRNQNNPNQRNQNNPNQRNQNNPNQRNQNNPNQRNQNMPPNQRNQNNPNQRNQNNMNPNQRGQPQWNQNQQMPNQMNQHQMNMGQNQQGMMGNKRGQKQKPKRGNQNQGNMNNQQMNQFQNPGQNQWQQQNFRQANQQNNRQQNNRQQNFRQQNFGQQNNRQQENYQQQQSFDQNDSYNQQPNRPGHMNKSPQKGGFQRNQMNNRGNNQDFGRQEEPGFNKLVQQIPPLFPQHQQQQQQQQQQYDGPNQEDSHFAKDDHREEELAGGEKKDEDEMRFDEQFRKWEEQFNTWKAQNQNHPDRVAYREYEMKFEECRKNLLERREQMRRRKQEEKMKKAQEGPKVLKGWNVSKPEERNTSQKSSEEMVEPAIPQRAEEEKFDEDDDIEMVDQVQEENIQKKEKEALSSLFQSSSGSGTIPGLDLVTESRREQQAGDQADESANMDSEQPQTSQGFPDGRNKNLAEISKNITSLLKNPDFANILSIVQGTQADQHGGLAQFRRRPDDLRSDDDSRSQKSEAWSNVRDPWAEKSGQRHQYDDNAYDSRSLGDQYSDHYGSNQGYQDNYGRNDSFDGNYGQNNSSFPDKPRRDDMFSNFPVNPDLDRSRSSMGGTDPFRNPGRSWNQDYDRGNFGNQGSDEIFMPTKVIDYQNKSQNPPAAREVDRWSHSDMLMPTKVVDYGHKKTVETKLEPTAPFVMTTIDYGHTSKNQPLTTPQPDGQKIMKFHPSKKVLRVKTTEATIEKAKQARRARVRTMKYSEKSNPSYPGKWILLTERPPFPEFPTKRGKRKTRGGQLYDPKARKARKLEVKTLEYEGISDDEEEVRENISEDEDFGDFEGEDNFESLGSDTSLPEVDDPFSLNDEDAKKLDTEINQLLESKEGEKKEVASKEEIQEEVQKNVPKVRQEPINSVNIAHLLDHPHRQVRPKKFIIIMRGPPGSGKSYFAKIIKDREVENGGSAPRILSIDDYYMTEVEKTIKCPDTNKMMKVQEMVYTYEEGVEEQYMQCVLKSFRKTIFDGFFNIIIVDCINKELENYKQFDTFARANGFKTYACEMDMDVNLCCERNSHERSLEDIAKIVEGWQSLPEDTPKISITSLEALAESLKGKETAEDEVDKETLNQPVEEEKGTEEEQGAGDDTEFGKSKWETDHTEERLARLDGTSKPLRHTTMEEFLQDADEFQMFEEDRKPGKKRVRWADIEERRAQEKMRAIGFVVGQTDWSRMMDPSQGSSALTQTKYIERTPK